MIKLFLIDILLRLLEKNVDYKNIDEDRINEWLAKQSIDIGYQEYFRRRDIQLLKTIANGLDRENYLIAVGQRRELLTQLQKIDKAGKTVKKEYGGTKVRKRKEVKKD